MPYRRSLLKACDKRLIEYPLNVLLTSFWGANMAFSPGLFWGGKNELLYAITFQCTFVRDLNFCIWIKLLLFGINKILLGINKHQPVQYVNEQKKKHVIFYLFPIILLSSFTVKCVIIVIIFSWIVFVCFCGRQNICGIFRIGIYASFWQKVCFNVQRQTVDGVVIECFLQVLGRKHDIFLEAFDLVKMCYNMP